MSNRHLPAGQNIQGGVGGMAGVDMGGGMGSGGPRRRQPQYMAQYHQQHMSPMYQGYAPYAPQQYYGVPPQFQNGGMHSSGYMPYQNYTRSPPTMNQYVPMAGVSVLPNYPRPAPQSPSLSTAYQPPPAPAPIPPHTPSSTHSSQMLPPPTPTTPQIREQVPVPPPAQESSPAVVARASFRPPLPWLSRPDVDFPTRTPRSRRRRKLLNADSQAVSLPVEQHEATTEQTDQEPTAAPASSDQSSSATAQEKLVVSQSEEQPAAASTSSESPKPSDAQPAAGVAATTSSAASTRPAAPAVPVVPALPKHGAKPSTSDKPQPATQQGTNGAAAESNTQDSPVATNAEPASNDTSTSSNPPVKAPPTSWANLFAKPATRAPAASAPDGSTASGEGVNGEDSTATTGTTTFPGSAFSKANTNSLGEAIRVYQVGSNDKISFLEPRGLINTGNMCYMNSVLQVLMFCVPFYDLLDQVSKKAAHSFKSETPLIDAMIMFMREYKVLKSAPSVEQLNRSLKSEDLERYGEPFTPEFVYEAIRQLSRFASMRRGHQQDAEEFLGFLLQSLDDECTHVMNTVSSRTEETISSTAAASGDAAAPSDEWLEVGHKQRPAVTRSSGHNTSTPITKIFGGLLRSEFRVPGLKDSITTERYQPLQLDIGSPDVRNVVDALRGLTRPERLQGDFNSPRGKDVVATKQVFIESLPPVLILHLKRFQFDAEGHGTVKIWKKIGYPLELEIPREALSRQKRQNIGEGSMPKYKLISVVYHHGKNASGGHYTVDVRRQDSHEWIRLDDTVIRRVRSEDVAETGSEEETKDTRKDGASGASTNRFGAMNDEDTGDEDGWKQVTAPTGSGKRWSSVVNGGTNGGTKEKQVKDSIKDNKVAYLLFYQRV